MDRLAAVNLALAGAQATKEGFQIVIGAVAFGPGVAGEEPRPTLPEGDADMGHHLGFVGMVLGVLFQFRQEVLDLTFDATPGWARLKVFGRIKAPIQFHQPVALALETPILPREGVATLDHGQQLVQERMAPFF